MGSAKRLKTNADFGCKRSGKEICMSILKNRLKSIEQDETKEREVPASEVLRNYQSQQSPILRGKLQNIETQQHLVKERVANENIRPSVSEAEQVREITQKIAKQFRDDISKYGINNTVREQIRTEVKKCCESLTNDYEQQQRLIQIAVASLIGLGPLEKYMADPEITEIIVQRYDNICVETDGVIHKVDASFTSEEHLQMIINRIVQPVGRQINLSTPIVDARLPDGSRVNATLPPVTPDGATLSIRKFSDKALTGDDYVRIGSLSQDMLDFLARCVEGKISIIVSGGTSTGKTTLLNMLSGYIPKEELIVTIEDSCELRLHQPNVRRMETRPICAEHMMTVNTQALVKNALRMRPDRIVVGEIRDGAIVDMISAMSTGHEGSLSTIHANNPQNLIHARIPILYSMNPAVNFTQESQNMQIAEAIQLIVQITRLRSGKRVISEITEVSGLTQDGNVRLNTIFRYNEDTNSFAATGAVPKRIINTLRQQKIFFPQNFFRLPENKRNPKTQKEAEK